jgi:hypothetical protein
MNAKEFVGHELWLLVEQLFTYQQTPEERRVAVRGIIRRLRNEYGYTKLAAIELVDLVTTTVHCRITLLKLQQRMARLDWE